MMVGTGLFVYSFESVRWAIRHIGLPGASSPASWQHWDLVSRATRAEALVRAGDRCLRTPQAHPAAPEAFVRLATQEKKPWVD